MIKINSALKIENVIFTLGRNIAELLIENAGIGKIFVLRSTKGFKVFISGMNPIPFNTFHEVKSFINNLRSETNQKEIVIA